MAAQLPRRRVLENSMAIVGGILVPLSSRTRALAAPAQLRKQDVRYQEQPKGSQRCETCSNFVNPDGCRVVAGPVDASGWCQLFQAKPA